MKELTKEENDILYAKAKDRMITWEELYEANKPWNDKGAILKLPYPIEYGGKQWNCLFYMKLVVDKGSAPVIIPMWARDDGPTLILCIPPKVSEALINEEKEKDEDSAAS